jgi:penicillin-binding protein 1A
MAVMMQGVVNSGTAGSLRSRFGLKGEMAGKTGTTNNNADGWYIGYTPQLTAGAWTGYENEQIHFSSTANGGGSSAALPIWGLFMKKVTSDPSLAKYYDKVEFDRPVGYDMDLSCTGEDVVQQEVVEGEGTPMFDDVEEEEYFD